MKKDNLLQRIGNTGKVGGLLLLAGLATACAPTRQNISMYSEIPAGLNAQSMLVEMGDNNTRAYAAETSRQMRCVEDFAKEGVIIPNKGEYFKKLNDCVEEKQTNDRVIYGVIGATADAAKVYLIIRGLSDSPSNPTPTNPTNGASGNVIDRVSGSYTQ